MLKGKQLKLIRRLLPLTLEEASDLSMLSTRTIMRVEADCCDTKYIYSYLELLYDRYLSDHIDKYDYNDIDDFNFIKNMDS